MRGTEREYEGQNAGTRGPTVLPMDEGVPSASTDDLENALDEARARDRLGAAQILGDDVLSANQLAALLGTSRFYFSGDVST